MQSRMPRVAPTPSVLDLVDPADHAAVERRLRQRLKGDSPTSTRVMVGRRADGTVVELDVYGSRTEHDGRPAVTGTMIDATERRERERAMQAREHLIEHAADVVDTCDLEGRMTSLNRAADRLQRRRATAMRVADFVTDTQRALVNELIQRQVREKRQDVIAEFQVVTRSGERRVLEVSTA